MSIDRISRRRLLASSVAGTAGALCWTHSLPAADFDPFSFVIATDTHLGRKDGKSAERNWRQAIEEINKDSSPFVLHLGDVVDSGRPAQYPIYADLRKSLNKPIHEIPGNHDPLELFHKHVAKKTDRSMDHGGVRFILFNNARRDSHHGFITPAQLRWLDMQCDGAVKKDLKVVICCHVPIHSNKHPDRGWFVKPKHGQQAFYKIRGRYADRILACLHGHFHNGIRGWRDHGDTVEVLCPSVCYNQNRGLTQHIADGKASGFFINELRPGYLVAEIGQRKLTLRYKPLGKTFAKPYIAKWS